MKFILKRQYHTLTNKDGNYTIGFLTNEEQSFRSLVLEDGYNKDKIHGQTRIPAGFYELGLRKEDTPLTLRHREAYKGLAWFDKNPDWYHIEVLKIPGYSGVYVHSGNDDSHTLGCLLPAYQLDMTLMEKPTSKSMLAVNDFYAIAYPLLDKGSKVHIEIRDEE